MYIGDQDTKATTVIQYFGPVTAEHSEYTGVTILFADDFDHKALPKSVRAHKMMTIDCTPRAGNELNETGIKRLRRILAALEGTPVVRTMPYGNSITEEEFFSRAAK